MSLLSVSDLSIEIENGNEKFLAVDGIAFDIEAGQTLCLIGPSGCGKTLTALSLCRLLPPRVFLKRGQILFRNKDIAHFAQNEIETIRGRHISYIFQDPFVALNPVMKVGLQVAEVITTHFPRKKLKMVFLEVCELFEKMGIQQADQYFHRYPHELSGGIRQRVMIAMAVACRPTLLIADEPTSSVDKPTQAQILKLLKSFQKESGMAMLLISHDPQLVSEMNGRKLEIANYAPQR